MNSKPVYVLGSGAIGFPLAAYLAKAGRPVVAVRTRSPHVPRGTVTVSVDDGAERVSAEVETVSLSGLGGLEGTMVVAAKAYANPAIARELAGKAAKGPVVILQNGVGVEKPFLEAGFPAVLRCVLYATGQAVSEHEFRFRPIAPSPIGIVRGGEPELHKCVEALNTEEFPFRAEANIQREVWKKAIINSVFNSICPLLEVDNGIFVRSEAAAGLALEVVRECLAVTDRLGLGLSEGEVMEQVLRISRGSEGQLISTLQDIRGGRPTEIEFLNLEIARVAASLQPEVRLPRVELLGRMVLAKSSQQMRKGSGDVG
jgi:2-dehydropantoate 2-reductase